MNLEVSEDAARWYKNELALQSTTHIRFFPRYGHGGHIPGFSIGINHDKPEETHISTEVGNIVFFIESGDAWYFEGVHLQVKLNRDRDEPEFLIKGV